MDEYLIGAGAVLRSGSEPSIARATLHAQTEPRLAMQIKGAVIDFEASEPAELTQVVIVAAGWDRRRFESAVLTDLMERRECSLGGVITVLARAVGSAEIHLFARWLPDAGMLEELRAGPVRLVVHPLESLTQMALVSGQRVRYWRPAFSAA